PSAETSDGLDGVCVPCVLWGAAKEVAIYASIWVAPRAALELLSLDNEKLTDTCMILHFRVCRRQRHLMDWTVFAFHGFCGAQPKKWQYMLQYGLRRVLRSSYYHWTTKN